MHLTHLAQPCYTLTMRQVFLAVLCTASLNLATPHALRAQGGGGGSVSPDKAPCSVWLHLDGTSGAPRDSVYNRCALDSAPFMFDSPGFTRLPPGVGSLNASLVLVVDPNFRINLELTRRASAPLPAAFDDGIYKTVERWHIAAGQKGRYEVRSAFPIVLYVSPRAIPMPALVKWRHIRSRSDDPDTMRGTWVAAAPDAPMSDAQIDGIYLATIRALADSHVVLAGTAHRYCAVFPPGDSLRARRLSNQLRNIIKSGSTNAARARTSFACSPGDSARQIVLGTAVRSEDNKVSLAVSGDFLQLYPRGILGRTWRAWRGECSAPVPATGAQVMHCNVEHVSTGTEEAAADSEKTRPQYVVKPAGGDSIRVRVIALGEGKWQTDTMFVTMALPPRIADHALIDSVSVCEGRQAFSATSARGRYMLYAEDVNRRFTVLRVRTDSAPRRYYGTTECLTPTASRSPLTAFVLGDVGTRDSTPFTTCFFGCTERHTIDPARHTLAEHAALTYRAANLRDEGGQYNFALRIDVDRAPEGLTPLAVFYFDRSWRSASVLRPFGVNAWVGGLGSDTGGGKNAPADQEVRIYFFRK